MIRSDLPTIIGLLQGAIEPGQVITEGSVEVEESPGALKRLIRICRLTGAFTQNDPATPVSG